MSRAFALSAFVLMVLGILPTWAQNTLPASSTSAPEDLSSSVGAHALKISAGDLLDLAVFDTPELSAKLRVDEHGNVSLPLAGVVSVSGMTAEQAGVAIEAHLRQTDILKDPHVSVTVLEYATQGVTVVGEVKSPGVYPLLGVHGLLDLISAAGGVTPNAGKAVTVTHRSDPDHPVIANIDSKPGSKAGLGIDVRPGDTIMVSHAGIVYVVGDVNKPGGFLIENNDRLTVMQAIALAQGTNRTASLNHARLIRKGDSGRQEVPVPLSKILDAKAPDLLLADGDILFVPSSAAKNALRNMESILPSVAGAAIYRVP
jgi:polysaccharide biosynthesis/export protein